MTPANPANSVPPASPESPASRSVISVVLADDAALIRAGVAHVLTVAGVRVLAQVGNATQLLAATAAHTPDVVISDIRMPPGHRLEGLEAALHIAGEHPRTGILLLSNHVETHTLAALLDGARAGVGYLLKDRVIDTGGFVDAVGRVARGSTVVDPQVLERLLAVRRQDDRTALLTRRERDVLSEMATGKSNLAVGEALAMSPKTVETHVRAIFTKLELGESPDENRRVKAVLEHLRAR